MYIDLHAVFEVGSLSSHAKSSFHGNQPSRDGDIVQHGDSGCAIPLAPQRAAGTTETTCQVRAKFIQVYHQEVGFVVNLFLCTQTILHIYIYARVWCKFGRWCGGAQWSNRYEVCNIGNVSVWVLVNSIIRSKQESKWTEFIFCK
jgi:hypothetical protein